MSRLQSATRRCVVNMHRAPSVGARAHQQLGRRQQHPVGTAAGVCRKRIRMYATGAEDVAANSKNTMYYMGAISIVGVGLAYAAVPLYKAFCQASGFAGTTGVADPEKVAEMAPVEERALRIRFNADTSATMQWKFRPKQKSVDVVPGETALAFYTATNPTDEPIIGISSYNVVPYEAGQYFTKIQCFCFEEQRLNPHEQVDMPVFFYIDPDFADDPNMAKVTEITLSYTFFRAKDGVSLESLREAGVIPSPSK